MKIFFWKILGKLWSFFPRDLKLSSYYVFVHYGYSKWSALYKYPLITSNLYEIKVEISQQVYFIIIFFLFIPLLDTTGTYFQAQWQGHGWIFPLFEDWWQPNLLFLRHIVLLLVPHLANSNLPPGQR